MAKQITSSEFKSEVLEASVPVLVDFFAVWCGPCKMVAPVLETISEELAGKAKIVKVDVDECNDLSVQYKILSVPTLLFFKDGQVVDQIIGAVPKNVMTEKLEALM